MNGKYPSRWFAHRTFTDGDKKLAIIWAQIECLGKWKYKKQIIQLDESIVPQLEDYS